MQFENAFLGVTLTAVTAQLGAARLAGVGFSTALAGLAAVPLAKGVGSSLGDFINKSLLDQSAGLKNLEADNQSALDKLKSTNASATDIQAQRIANLRSEAEQIVAESDKHAGARTGAPFADETRSQFDAAVAQFARVSQQVRITDQDIKDVETTWVSLQQLVQNSNFVTRGTFQPEINQFAAGFEKLKQLKAEQDSFKFGSSSTTLQSAAAAGDPAATKKANADLIKDDKDTLDRIIQARQKFANDLKHLAQQSETDAIAAKKRTVDLSGQLDDQQFNFTSKRFNSLQQFTRDKNRADQLSADAARRLATAQTPDQTEAANKEFQRASAFAQQAAAAAQLSGNRTAQVQAEKSIEQVLGRELAATQQQAIAKQQLAAQANAASAAEQARVDNIAKTTKSFLDNLNQFDSKGNKLPEAQLSINKAQAQKDLQHLQDTIFSPSSKFDISQVLGFDKLRDRLNQAVTGTRINDLTASGQALTSLVQQVQAGLNAQSFSVNVQANVVGGGGSGGGEEEESFGGAIHRAMGGLAFFGSGGGPRGTDTVPAFLSPGEMVINAGASRQFFSQLMAINSGLRPNFRPGGGNTTNNTINNQFDIKGDNPQIIARQVAGLLKRESRRGTI